MPVAFLVLGAVALVVAGVAAVASRRPDVEVVERTAMIDAPPSAVFPYIADFREWAAWSPWEGLDPAMRKVYAGSLQGVGQVYAWEGNRKVGAGSMTMEGVEDDAGVVIRLEFLRPFKAVNHTTLRLTPAGTGTRVRWTMRAPQTLGSKVMGLAMDLEAMIGRDFEKGLRQLDEVAVAGRAVPAPH